MIFSHYKRFKEHFIADPEFEKKFLANPQGTLDENKIKVDAELLRPVWDKLYHQTREKPFDPFREIEKDFKYFENYHDKDLVDRLKMRSIKNPNYAGWRQRQIERTKSIYHKHHNDILIHMPFAFELSKGCSGGCVFCAFDPPPLQDNFYYTSENAKLWKKVLNASKQIVGYAAGMSTCYWATDPFDNPDYEKYCLDFHTVHGCFPPTTTVKALENPARTRELIKLSNDKGLFYSIRLSVVSLSMLKKIHAEFSAEELEKIPLSLNNKESKMIYCASGRATRMAYRANHRQKYYNEGSTACMSGFLVNMVDKSIKLITPCNPSEKWPLGYIIYDQVQFESGDDFGARIKCLVEKYMPSNVRETDVVRFRPDLEFKANDNGFKISTRFMKREFGGGRYIRDLGLLIHEGKYTLREIYQSGEFMFTPKSYIDKAIKKLFDSGVIDEEPICF